MKFLILLMIMVQVSHAYEVTGIGREFNYFEEETVSCMDALKDVYKKANQFCENKSSYLWQSHLVNSCEVTGWFTFQAKSTLTFECAE